MRNTKIQSICENIMRCCDKMKSRAKKVDRKRWLTFDVTRSGNKQTNKQKSTRNAKIDCHLILIVVVARMVHQELLDFVYMVNSSTNELCMMCTRYKNCLCIRHTLISTYDTRTSQHIDFSQSVREIIVQNHRQCKHLYSLLSLLTKFQFYEHFVHAIESNECRFSNTSLLYLWASQKNMRQKINK